MDYRLTKTERILQTYSLEEILEFNDLAVEDFLDICIDRNILSLPNPRPVDCYDDED